MSDPWIVAPVTMRADLGHADTANCRDADFANFADQATTALLCSIGEIRAIRGGSAVPPIQLWCSIPDPRCGVATPPTAGTRIPRISLINNNGNDWDCVAG
jgi:hypothetical protein